MNIKDSSQLTKKYKQILSAVHIVYRLVNATTSLKELSLRLTRLLCQFVHAHSAKICLLGPDRSKIEMVAVFNNQINFIVTKKKDIEQMSQQEISVTRGVSVFGPRIMGVPLITDECIGSIIIKRREHEEEFDEYDKEMFSIFAEQSVTAIRNLQVLEDQQKIILETMKFIQIMLEKQAVHYHVHSSEYFKIVKTIAMKFRMNHEQINSLYYASVLHNIGAIDVPYQVLAKRGQLTSKEFEHIRSLPKKSVELIKPIDFLRPVLPIILALHENYDGTGYPSKLKGENIPLGARIMKVVSAFESMVQGRPYRKKISFAQALVEMKRSAGIQFDPQVVDIFLMLVKNKNFKKSLNSIR